MPRGVSRYDEAQLQGRLWTPEEVRGDLSCWWDFSERGSLTHATGISAIKSRHKSDVTMEEGTGSKQPAFSATGINGRACANFSGTNNTLGQFTTANSVMSNSFTAVVVSSVLATSGANTRVLGYCTSGNDYDSPTALAVLYRSAANTLSTFQNGSARASSAAADGVVSVVVVESDGTTCRHFINGTAGGSGAWGTITLGSSGRWLIGKFSVGASETDHKGLWGEGVVVRLYAPHLRQRLEGYLAHRWGLASSLAASHPFRNSPPLIGS